MIAPLVVELRPSPVLIGALFSAHLLALVSVWIALAGWPFLFVSAGLLISLFVSLSESRLRGADSVQAIELRDDRQAAWKDRRGVWHDTQLGRGHFVSSLLILVALQKSPRHRKWIVLLPDSATPDYLRRLRVRLRLESGDKTSGSPRGDISSG